MTASATTTAKDAIDDDAELERLRRIAQKPFGVFLLDQLALLSPHAFMGVAEFRKIDNIWKRLAQGLAGILLPMVGYRMMHTTLWSQRGLPAPNKSLLVPYLLSPWTIGWLVKATAPLRQVIQMVFTFRTTRSPVLPDAWTSLGRAIESKRAYRKRRYDVYLPPPRHEHKTAKKQAILFLPGASVETSAYAGPATLLSNQGYLVVIVSNEPLLLTAPAFGTNARRIRQIQREIEIQHGVPQDAWFLLGHSMGGFTGSSLVQELNITKLVLWGVAPGFVESLQDLSESNIQVLVVQGTRDKIVELFTDAQKTKEFWRRLPPNTQERLIEDGTHSGFASYTSTFAKEDEIIPRAQQHLQAVQYTVDFLES